MDWMIRYLLGLPCRKQDREALQRAIPELFTKGISVVDFERLIEYSVFRLRSRGVHLRDWAGTDDSEGRPQPQLSSTNNSCPLEHCPCKAGRTLTQVGAGQDEQSRSGGSESIYQLMTLGGNIGAQAASRDRKDEKHTAISQFRGLLKKVHEKNAGSITEIILTDPYLHMDIATGEI